MIVTSSSFELHPIGSFYGKIVRIEEDISKFDAKPQLVLTVETEPLYGEKKERSLLYWTSTSLSPQSKLGSVYMPMGVSGWPMTYMHEGSQYIVMPISGGAFPGEFIAYRLPE